MLQHDHLRAVDFACVDRPGRTVHLPLPVGESVDCARVKFVYPISSPFGLLFRVHLPQAMFKFALQICPYNAIKFLPRRQQEAGNPRRAQKQLIGKNFRKLRAQIQLKYTSILLNSV